jgi:hypothetical protein
VRCRIECKAVRFQGRRGGPAFLAIGFMKELHSAMKEFFDLA